MENVVSFGPEFDDFWTKTPLRSGLGGPWEHRLASGGTQTALKGGGEV